MRKKAVLLVEDSPEVRKVVSEIVDFFGFNVTVASDGNEAWRKIRKNRFDLVITDMGMPNLTGDELTRKMRENDIETPVILIAGVDIAKGLVSSKTFSNCKFVQKPFIIEELRDTMADSLGLSGSSRKKHKTCKYS